MALPQVHQPELPAWHALQMLFCSPEQHWALRSAACSLPTHPSFHPPPPLPSTSHQVGLATLSAAVQRSGGSLQHPSQQLDDELEERAASIEGGAGPEAFGFGFQCLSEDTPGVLQLFAEVRSGVLGNEEYSSGCCCTAGVSC